MPCPSLRWFSVSLGTVIALVCGAAADATAQLAVPAQAPPGLLREARQLLLVITPDWNTVGGELRRFERSASGAPWQSVGAETRIVVGRNGLAWDPLASPVIDGPTKREGDGRAPAGVFPLGTAFGYAPASDTTARALQLPYLPVTEGIECIDDVKSAGYNTIVNRRSVAVPDWTSSERMREVGEEYRWGVVVNYNTPAVAGRGSCIFLHIANPKGTGTAGCTAMSADALLQAMGWLSPERQPVLVQLPRAAYDLLREAWRMP
jgi:D-alanyl-D-alanine dipeptidase